MPKFCAVVGCHNQSVRDLNFSFFKLPRPIKLRDLWIKAINRTDSDQCHHWYVCSAHFETGRPVLTDLTHNDHKPHLKMGSGSGRKRSQVKKVQKTYSRAQKCLKLQTPEEKQSGGILEEELLKWCNDQILLSANLGLQISDETLQAQAGLIWRTLNPAGDSASGAPTNKWISDFRQKHAETFSSSKSNNTAILQLVVTPPGIPPQLVNLPVLITEQAARASSSTSTSSSSSSDEEYSEERAKIAPLGGDFKIEVKEEKVNGDENEELLPTGEEALSAVETVKRFLRQDKMLCECAETSSALLLVEELVQEKYFEMKSKINAKSEKGIAKNSC